MISEKKNFPHKQKRKKLKWDGYFRWMQGFKWLGKLQNMLEEGKKEKTLTFLPLLDKWYYGDCK